MQNNSNSNNNRGKITLKPIVGEYERQQKLNEEKARKLAELYRIVKGE